MKRLLSFALLINVFIACNDSAKVKSATLAKNSDLTQQNLKGKVQVFEETSYTIDSTGANKKDSLVNVNEFDGQGYQFKSSTKNLAGKIHTVQTITHGENGVFKEVVTLLDGKQTYRLITEYDKDGKYTGGKSFDSTGKQDSYYTDLSTNDYGIVYAGKQHFLDGRIKSTWDNKFDGPIYVSGTSTDSTGKVSYSGSIKVNDKGDAIEEISTTREKDSTKTEKMTYKYDSYDDNGNWTQRTTYNEKGKPSKIVNRAFTY